MKKTSTKFIDLLINFKLQPSSKIPSIGGEYVCLVNRNNTEFIEVLAYDEEFGWITMDKIYLKDDSGVLIWWIDSPFEEISKTQTFLNIFNDGYKGLNRVMLEV